MANIVREKVSIPLCPLMLVNHVEKTVFKTKLVPSDPPILMLLKIL